MTINALNLGTHIFNDGPREAFFLPAWCSPVPCQFDELGKRQHGEAAAAVRDAS